MKLLACETSGDSSGAYHEGHPMSMLTFDRFNAWLEEYGRAWVTGDAGSVPRLFSENARYEETPFDEPMVGLGAISRYWEEGAGRSQKDVRVSFEIASVEGAMGLAHWSASFARVPSGNRVELDGMLQAEFAGDGKCVRFREWWHRRESGPSGET